MLSHGCMTNKLTIRVIKHDGKFVGLVILGGSRVGTGDPCDTKSEARKDGWRAAEEMGLVNL